MYQALFKQLKDESLRYMSPGWTRFHPYLNVIESHPIDADSPSDLFMEFGDKLDKILRLRCECKIKDGHEVYRFKLDKVEREHKSAIAQVSIEVGEKIKNVQIYETYNGEILKEINTEGYFPNGLLIEFTSGNFLGILGQEGDDQCEPCHYIKFIPKDEIETYKIESMKHWTIREQIVINV